MSLATSANTDSESHQNEKDQRFTILLKVRTRCEHRFREPSPGWMGGVLGFHFNVRDATKNGPYLELQGLSAVLVTTDRKPGPSSSFFKKSKIAAAPVGAARIFLFGKVTARPPAPLRSACDRATTFSEKKNARARRRPIFISLCLHGSCRACTNSRANRTSCVAHVLQTYCKHLIRGVSLGPRIRCLQYVCRMRTSFGALNGKLSKKMVYEMK